MRKNTRYLGLDVHAETIAVAVAEAGRNGEVRSLGTIPNRAESVHKLIKKLGARGLEVCYEAGPCGYGLYWLLQSSGWAVRWSRRRWCRSSQATGSRPTVETRSSWRDVCVPAS